MTQISVPGSSRMIGVGEMGRFRSNNESYIHKCALNKKSRDPKQKLRNYHRHAFANFRYIQLQQNVSARRLQDTSS